VPIFGDWKDANIQIAAAPLILAELIDAAALQIPAWILDQVDTSQPLPKAPPKLVPLADLLPEYRGQRVPDHRTLYPIIQPLVAGGSQAALVAAQTSLAAPCCAATRPGCGATRPVAASAR
jgi:hypothetical protein